jgi:ABC-type microcin C transport system permease subunit YejB
MNADYGYKHADARRSVYVPVFRNAMLDIVEAFDAA